MATITQEESNGFRFIKALNLCGRGVLHHVFCWGAPDKASGTKLDEYLNNLDQTSSANFLKLKKKDRKFNKTQNKLINMSPDGRGFDVPLLCLSIKLGCENVASVDDLKWITPSTEMEYYITAVKNLRNDALHSQLAVPNTEYLENIRKLREVLTGCLKASGERYGKDEAEVNKEINQLNHDLDYIMNEILEMEEIVKYCSDDIKQLIITESCNKLKEILQEMSYMSPFSCITNNFQLKANKFFIDIQVKQGKRRGKGEHKDYRDLLQLVQSTSVSSSVNSATQQQSPSARPQILLLEGLAGSGKTTLVKLITEEWIQGGQGNMRGLDDYDLLLWVQCRDHSMNSYQDLLDRLIPDVSAKYRMVLPRIMKLCKVLIIVDGLDELNDHSSSLVKSLLYEFQNSIYTTFICTSRPEKVEIFSMTIPEGYDVTNAELQGIKQEHMPEFVRSTHEIIKKNNNSNSSTDLLVEKVMSVRDLYEHLRLPMNLAFFVYIWEYAPDEINVMTVTQTRLYHKIHEVCQKKLLERLADCSDLQHKVQEILRMIYETSLENLSREQLTLEEETVERLISACNKRDLPYNEILSAFLSLKPIWTWQGIKEQYSVPHKGIQDYFSALHCVMTLKDQLQSSANTVSRIQNATPPVLSQLLDTTDSPSQTPLTPVSSKLPDISVSPSPSSLASVAFTSEAPTRVPPILTSTTLASPAQTPTLSLREVLTQSVGGASIDMTKYYNVLLHVAGLLHHLIDQVPEATTQEAAKLLHESGMREHEMWLNLLQNTRCNNNIAKAIAPFCNAKYVRIDDKHVESYKALLPHTKRSEVNIVIKGNFGEMPGLVDLIEVVSLYHHRCTRLDLACHYYQYDTTTSDEFLQRLQPRSHLVSFMGRLSGDGVSLLPPNLTDHLCVVSDDHARSLLPQLHHAVTTKLLYLEYFDLRMPAGVSPAALMPLPKSKRVQLTLTDVSDTCTDDAGVVIQALQPPGRYWDISFDSCTATVVGIQDMIRGMADRGVKVNCVTVNTAITKQQEDELVTLAKSILQCRLTVFDVSTAVAKPLFD